MDLTFSPHAIRVPYVQENAHRARLLCRRVDFDQNAADFYAQHDKTETAYMTPQYISSLAYTTRRDIDGVGVHEEDEEGEEDEAEEREDRIAQMFAKRGYQNGLELMLGFNADIEGTQGVTLQSNQQASAIQSLHLNLQGQSTSTFDVDGKCPATVSYSESFGNPSWSGRLQQDVFSGTAQPKYELPHSFETNSTSGVSFSTVDSWPLSTRRDEPLHQPRQSWGFPTTQVSNNVQITEVNPFPCESAEPCRTVPLFVLPSQTSATTVSSHGFSPPINSPFDYTSPMNEAMPSQAPSPLPTEERLARDELLIECRRANMTYKDIKEQYGFEQSISTLRGRHRNLTKQKHERVRKPNWTHMDIQLLKIAVEQFKGHMKGRRPKYPGDPDALGISWKSVADYVATHGSYRFGHATCKKKWMEVNRIQPS